MKFRQTGMLLATLAFANLAHAQHDEGDEVKLTPPEAKALEANLNAPKPNQYSSCAASYLSQAYKLALVAAGEENLAATRGNQAEYRAYGEYLRARNNSPWWESSQARQAKINANMWAANRQTPGASSGGVILEDVEVDSATVRRVLLATSSAFGALARELGSTQKLCRHREECEEVAGQLRELQELALDPQKMSYDELSVLTKTAYKNANKVLGRAEQCPNPRLGLKKYAQTVKSKQLQVSEELLKLSDKDLDEKTDRLEAKINAYINATNDYIRKKNKHILDKTPRAESAGG